MNNNEKSFFAPSKAKAAIIYVLGTFVFVVFFAMLASVFVAKIRGVEVGAIIACFTKPKEATAEVKAAYYEAYSWGNFFGYLVALLGIIVFMRNDFITDYQQLMENKKKYSIILPIFAIGFAILATGISHVFDRIVPESANQSTIVLLLQTPAIVPMIISTIILAPIVEEMIYRKAIFSAFRAYGVIPAYITSIVLFTLPHMISTSTSIGIWILQCIPYALCGLLLCVIYHKSNKNVYVSIMGHALNNLIAVLFVLL